MGGGGEGKEVWETATMAEEDKIMEEAAKLMKLHKVPSDFRQFVSDCCRIGGGADEEWENELDVRKWSFELLKAAVADGSVNSGEWDSLPCSAVLPVPMPAFMFKNVLAYELKVAAEKSEEVEEEVLVEKKVGVEEEVVLEEEIVGKEECVGNEESVVQGKLCGEKVPVGQNGKERVWEAVLPSSWGALLPAATPTISNLSPVWRPWETDDRTTVNVKLPGPWKLGQWRRKRRSPAAEARSQRRLHKWQEQVDLQRGFNRLPSEQRNFFTPLPAPKEIRSVRLVERLGDVKGSESGSQALPSNQCHFGGERRGFPGSGGEGQGLYAGGIQHFSSLLQIPIPISAESSFPTPPPPPSFSAKWRGDWWLVPAGMSTQCASCRLWGPLSPGR